MRTFTKIGSILAIFVLMLTGAWATAQSGKDADKKAGDPPAPADAKKAKTTGSTQNAQANPYFHDHQNQGDMPTHQRIDSPANQNSANSTGGMQNAQSNPMYKDNKMEGTNPLYEGNSSAKSKAPSSGATESHQVVQYRETDDRVTRTRPGNNKAPTVRPVGPPSSTAVVEYKDGEDGTMHTRPSNPK